MKSNSAGFPEVTVPKRQRNDSFSSLSEAVASLFSLHSKPIHAEPNLFIDSVTYTKLVNLSTKTGSLLHGRLAHAHMVKTSFKPCTFLLNSLIAMYCKHGDICTAKNLFDRMPKRNIVSYNSMISGYYHMGFCHGVMFLFNEARRMVRPDKFTYAGALAVCARRGNVELGKLIHGLVVVGGLSENVFVNNCLIDMYSKCGQVDGAKLLFESSSDLDGVSWNSLISGYAQLGAREDIFKLLTKMHRFGLKFNSYTLGSALKVCCTGFGNSQIYGKILHGYTVKNGLDMDIVVGTALLDMYAKTGDIKNAIQLFNFMSYQNIIMYNAMIAALVQTETASGCSPTYALDLFTQMQRHGIQPSNFTFSSILGPCLAIPNFECGKQIHAQICKRNLQSDDFIGSALIELYSYSGSTEDGLRCFNLTSKADIVSWTSMIAGYVQNGKFENALKLFHQLLSSGVKPDEFVISSVVGACAHLAAVRSGEQILGYGIKSGIVRFTVVQNSYIYMYAKCGDIVSARFIFSEIEKPDVVSWSVMICSNGQHGFAKEALDLFELMITYGLQPNNITFTGILTACSHGGLVEEGMRYFEMMKKDYGMEFNARHCACVVDLLGRAGRLEEAHNYILDSGFEDDPVMWRALLSACRVYKNTGMGSYVAEKVIELEPLAAASYVLLYNIYNDAGVELPATKVRRLMYDRGLRKEPSSSWIEVGNKF